MLSLPFPRSRPTRQAFIRSLALPQTQICTNCAHDLCFILVHVDLCSAVRFVLGFGPSFPVLGGVCSTHPPQPGGFDGLGIVGSTQEGTTDGFVFLSSPFSPPQSPAPTPFPSHPRAQDRPPKGKRIPHPPFLFVPTLVPSLSLSGRAFFPGRRRGTVLYIPTLDTKKERRWDNFA